MRGSHRTVSAKFEVELITELVDTLTDMFRLHFQVLVVVKPISSNPSVLSFVPHRIPGIAWGQVPGFYLVG